MKHDGEKTNHGEPEPQDAVGRAFPKLWYIFVLPVIAAYVATVALLVAGFVETFRVIVEVATHPGGHALETLRLHFIEVIDVFLLATVLYVIGAGFWQLFLGQPPRLPEWMKVNSTHDLEVMLIGVVITLLGVTALAAVMTWDGETNLLPLGVTVGLVIAALALFLRRSSH